MWCCSSGDSPQVIFSQIWRYSKYESVKTETYVHIVCCNCGKFFGIFFWVFQRFGVSKKGILWQKYYSFFEDNFSQNGENAPPKKIKIKSLATTRHAFLSTMKSASFFFGIKTLISRQFGEIDPVTWKIAHLRENREKKYNKINIGSE